MAGAETATMETLGEARKRKGWSMEELARRTGLAYTTVWKIENGKTTGTPSTRLALANALGVGVDDIDWPRKGEGGEQ